MREDLLEVVLSLAVWEVVIGGVLARVFAEEGAGVLEAVEGTTLGRGGLTRARTSAGGPASESSLGGGRAGRRIWTVLGEERELKSLRGTLL